MKIIGGKRIIITSCPLVVGVIHDKCYLIDKFNTTPLEQFAITEFTK